MIAPLGLREAAGERTLHEILAHAPVFLFAGGPGPDWDYVNPPFYSFTGLSAGSALGDGWLRAVHPDDSEALRKHWREATVNGGKLSCEARFRRHDGAWRWHLIQASARGGAGGRVLGWTGSCVDIDERRAMETRQVRMLSELQHRIRNILALVRSVLTRTMETSDDLDHFASHLNGRISALARAQGAAARTPQRVVRLDELLHDELIANGGNVESQFEIAGPPVLLTDRIATAIALAFHELTTNSIKFGALSTSGGVRVHWQLFPGAEPPQRRLLLTWQETGVPLVDLRPSRRGFGRELIEQGLPYELGAATELVFKPGGVCCRIELLLTDDPNADLSP